MTQTQQQQNEARAAAMLAGFRSTATHPYGVAEWRSDYLMAIHACERRRDADDLITRIENRGSDWRGQLLPAA